MSTLSIFSRLNADMYKKTTYLTDDRKVLTKTKLNDQPTKDDYDLIILWQPVGKVYDLHEFINAKTIYMYCPEDTELINVPPSVDAIYFRMPGDRVKLPYVETVKTVQNLSSMGESTVFFSGVYHKHRLHHFDYKKAVQHMSALEGTQPYSEEALDEYVRGA